MATPIAGAGRMDNGAGVLPIALLFQPCASLVITPSPEEGDTLRVTLERSYANALLRVRDNAFSALVVPLSVRETGSMLAPSRGGSFAFFFPGKEYGVRADQDD